MSTAKREPYLQARRTAWLSKGLETLIRQLTQNPRPDHPEANDFDLIIVGTGYGGAVAAAEFSRFRKADGTPLKICLLERGKEYLPGSFPSRLADLPGHVRFTTPNASQQTGVYEGLFDLRLSNDAVAVVASGVGGGSLINAGVMEMPRPEVFAEGRWPEAIRADHDHLVKLADEWRPRLGARKLDPSPYPKTARLHEVTPDAGRFESVPIQVSQTNADNTAGVGMDACIGCGDCATGCNHNAKESLDVNLLREATRADGVQLFTGATVFRIAPRDQGKRGWSVWVNHTAKHLRARQKESFELRSKWVILAAGTLGSTEILMRSTSVAPDAERFRPSAQLGKKVSANGDMMALAYAINKPANAVADEDVDPERRGVGPTISGMIDLRTGDPATDVVIQDLAVPGPLRRLFEEASTTSDVINRLPLSDWSRHRKDSSPPDETAVNPDLQQRSLLVAMIGRDNADGVLKTSAPEGLNDKNDGMLTISWPELRYDIRFDHHHTRLESYLWRLVGGRVWPNIMWRPLSDRLEQIFGKQRGPLITVHPLGGCPMGDDIAAGVTNDCGEVFRDDGAPQVADRECYEGPAVGGEVFRDGPPQAAGRDCYEGLAVLDGSIIPTSLGINPSLTIAALAARAAPRLSRKWGLATEAKTATPPHEDRPRFARLPPPVPPEPTKIELTEQLRGEVVLKGSEDGRRRFFIEITFTSAPTAVAGLIAREVPKGGFRGFDVPTRLAKEAIVPRARLRLLDGPPDNVADDWTDTNVLLEAELSGRVKLYPFAGSTAVGRILRAGWAWVRNRALRDITQLAIRKGLRWLRFLPPKSSAFNFSDSIRLLTRAGAIRLIDYDFKIEKVTKQKKVPAQSFEGKRLHGVKRISYKRFGSPVAQLIEVYLVSFPLLSLRSRIRRPKLTLNYRYLARKRIPLIRIVNQENHVAGLMDVAAFLAHGLRVVTQAHALSFRKPDPPADRVAQRLCGPIDDVPPEIVSLTVPVPGLPEADIRLARYRREGSQPDPGVPNRPVLLIHGYSASGTIFAHPLVGGNLVETLTRSGRDVWVIDLRSSAGMPSARQPWAFEHMGLYDIPVAIDHIVTTTGSEQVDVVAHCMGAAMFSIGLLSQKDRFGNDNQLHKRIGRVVFSQVGPFMIMTPDNVLRGYLMRYLEPLLRFDDYEFSPRGDSTLSGQLLDRALAALALTPEEFRRENPIWPLGKVTPWVGTRHRMDALYARTFALRNMSEDVLYNIDDFLGPLSVKTASQAVHFMPFNTVTDSTGANNYVYNERIEDRLTFPIFSIHGEDNGLIDVATLELTRRALVRAGYNYLNPDSKDSPQHCATQVRQDANEMTDLIKQLGDRISGEAIQVPATNSQTREVFKGTQYMTWRIEKHGHLDCLIGTRAGMISRVVRDFLGAPDAPGRDMTAGP